MNSWFERLHDAFAQEAGAAQEIPAEAAEAVRLTQEEVQALLDLARDAAHGSGARQYAPLAAYLAGRAAQTAGLSATPAARVALIQAITRAVQAAGAAGGAPL